MNDSAAETVFIPNFSDREIVVALSILEQLPQLTYLLKKKPNVFLSQYIFSSIGVVNNYYRKDPLQNEFIDALLSYWRCVLNSRWRDAEKCSVIVSSCARDLKKPPPGAFLSPLIIVLLVVTAALSVAVLVLIATSSCCKPTDIVAIVLSGVSIIIPLALILIMYKTYRSKFLGVMTGYTDLFLDAISSFGNPRALMENPLSNAPQNEYKDETSGILLDKEAIFHNRKQINELLATVTEDEGNIVLKPKSLPPALASLSAIYRHTIIVMTDNEGKIVLFSEGAADNLGFSIRDTEGRNINTLLFGEKSFDLYTTMTDGAKKNVDMTEKVLTLAHQTLGSVSISANVVIAKDAETGEHVGFALIGSVHSDELFRTQSLFHHFFVRELLQLKIKDARYKQIIDCLQWKNLRDLSTLAKEWNSVHVRRVLSDIIKGRTDKVDVEVDPKVLELPSIICDETGMSSALSRTFELFNGKLKIRVELQRTTEAINQLVVIYLHHNNSVDKVQLKSLMHILNDMGGLLLESPGTLKLQFPFILEDDGNQALQQNRNMAVKSSGSDPLVILLLEKNALHRHNISNLVWNCGHSLRIVENVKKALQAIESSTDLSCALVDIDMKEGERVVDTLISKHIYTIETSETPGNFTKRGDALLKKPIDRDELLREFENASKLMKRMGVLGKVRNSPWTQGRMLGKGGFAAVYEATSTLTGGKMAVKVITLPNDYEDRMDDFVSEIEILCKLEHPNIIHYFYCERSDNTLYLFMALADQGTVADLLKKYPRLPESHIATLMKQLLQAVNYLHACDIIHRDIKPANMLLSHGQMKLSDFGTATTTSAEGVVGTLYYMAPEVVDGKQSGKESDIWSIGCVASECLHVARSGGLLGYGPPTNFPPDVSPELVDFIKRCTAADPNDRASAGALLLHDFIVHLENEVEDLSEVPPEAIAQYSKSKHKSEEADGSVSSAPSWSFN